jgi:hypothetical protein
METCGHGDLMPEPVPQVARPDQAVDGGASANGLPWRRRLWRRRWSIGLAAAIAAGIVFRLIWLRDIEYKADEAWTVIQVQAFWQSHIWSPVGIPSSEGLPHPGLSLWLFVAISALLPTAGPLELTRAVQVINVIAIILLAFFAQKVVVRGEREPWLWSVALLSVNPLAVLYSRKLWAQDILPLFTVGMLFGWWYRQHRWGAFLWGLVGALLGQVHLTGFVFAAAFFGFVLMFDRRSARWFAWLAGSLLGLIPLLPWLVAVSKGFESARTAQLNNPAIPFGNWINFSLGLDLQKTLGDDFSHFLAFPGIQAHSSYLAAVLLGAIVLIFVILLGRLTTQLRADRARTIAVLRGTRSSTSLALNAGFLGYCSLLAMMFQPIYLHYIIVALPLPLLWLAWIARAGSGESAGSTARARFLLTALVMAQAGVTVMFLAYIHQAQIIHGDYGVAFGAQSDSGIRR